ncbi:MAG TPA: phosphatase PAP2 family protein [Thermoanaerobaculia bacterium]|nr:phosphatase PAP2 family protein [Thermoanaerobaculia bacterium]
MTNHLDPFARDRLLPGGRTPLVLILGAGVLLCRMAYAAAGPLADWPRSPDEEEAAEIVAPQASLPAMTAQAPPALTALPALPHDEPAVAPAVAAEAAPYGAPDPAAAGAEATTDAGAAPRSTPERRLNPVRVLAYDARAIFTAPGHWQRRQWAIFSAEVLGVAVVSKSLDRSIRNEDVLAADLEPLGSWGSFGVLGLFYLDGVWRHDAKARHVAEDGLAASIIASGVITPFLKLALGRSRPSQNRGNYHFHPFSGDASFPSGHATQAFAVASVIASTYKQAWVQIVSYGAAGLVGFGRLRHNAHFASDVIVGALIGDSIGRAVVHANRRLRTRVAVAPLVGPGERGLVLTAAF